MSKDKVANIEIWAHRWTDTYGNMYFRAQALANGKVVHTDTKMQCGYGDAYVRYGWERLINLGLLSEDAADIVPSRYCREHGVVFSAHAVDGLKRELPFWEGGM